MIATTVEAGIVIMDDATPITDVLLARGEHLDREKLDQRLKFAGYRRLTDWQEVDGGLTATVDWASLNRYGG